MAAISYYDADLTDGIEKLNDLMDKVAAALPGARSDLLVKVDVKLSEVMELKNAFQLALQQASCDQDAAYHKKFEEYCGRLEEISSDFRLAKVEQERSDLFKDQITISTARDRDLDGLGYEEVLEKAMEIQFKIDQSLMATAKMLEQSKSIAATVATLRSQREHIVEITDSVMGIEDMLQRTHKLLRLSTRRMAIDRVVLLLMFLAIIGVAGIIGYKIIKSNATTIYVPDDFDPPNPTALNSSNAIAMNSTIVLQSITRSTDAVSGEHVIRLPLETLSSVSLSHQFFYFNLYNRLLSFT